MDGYIVMCPNAVMGCRASFSRAQLGQHLLECRFGGYCGTDAREKEEVGIDIEI